MLVMIIQSMVQTDTARGVVARIARKGVIGRGAKVAPARGMTTSPTAHHAILVGMVIIPFALYGALTTTGCAVASQQPTPTTSATSKSVEPPTAETACGEGLVETSLQGTSFCCSPALRWCEAKGSPVYDQPCDEAGTLRLGITVAYHEDTCDTAAFNATEDRLTTQYECRSEDGIQPVWRYVEPSSFCMQSVSRTCVSSAVVEVANAPVGNGCN